LEISPKPTIQNPDTLNLIENPTSRQPGFHLQHKEWVTLNRIRTRHGKTGQILSKWGLRPTSECDCGSTIQTIEHFNVQRDYSAKA